MVADRDLDVATAGRIAAKAARGVGHTGAVEFLRSGVNHVFRAGDLVVRVAPVDASAHVALARVLAAEGIPIVLPVDDALEIEGAYVTMWEFIEPGSPIDFGGLGEAVARLHRVPPDRVSPLPWCGDADWLQIDHNLEMAAETGVVGHDDIAALWDAFTRSQDWQSRARAEPPVVCHGDVHPQNVLMRGDEPVIIDWDSICLGPAAWDHAALITWENRWGGVPGTYDAFARGYGADLRGSSLASLLAGIRLLAPTVNMIINGARDPVLATEARARMRYWLGEPDAPPWTPQ